jgi:AraC-like DNA-binding protein
MNRESLDFVGAFFILLHPMYAYLFFGLALLYIFSIFENFKSGQKISLFKINIILLLVVGLFANSFDFLAELGFVYKIPVAIIRLLGILFLINFFYMIAMYKLPKWLILFEGILFAIYAVFIFNGFQFGTILNGNIVNEVTLLNKITYFIIPGFFIGSLTYSLIIIFKRTDNANLYQIKIKRWAVLLFVSLFLMISLVFSVGLLYFKKISSTVIDTRMAYIMFRFLTISFILFRPEFLDQSGYELKLNFIKPSNHKLSLYSFEFLFFGNQYFLNPNANLEDFALKMNHTKREVSEFIKSQFNDTFLELLNKNRVSYFKELLRSKQYESFTIEALSEMSGFNNRQSMYNAFKKYEGCSPSEYITNL